MKTCSLYGFISALAGAFITLILYFLGFHSDVSKLTAASWIGGLLGLAVTVICLVLGVRARRDETPKDADFGYGSALWAGTLISVVSSALSAIFTYAYYAFINPAFAEIVLQDKQAKLEASGMSGDRLEKMEAMNRWFMNPVPMAVTTLIMIIVIGVVLSLIVAAFLKRPAPNTPSVV
jgi:ABC-type Fe3+-siderophore transport system permease subunit